MGLLGIVLRLRVLSGCPFRGWSVPILASAAGLIAAFAAANRCSHTG